MTTTRTLDWVWLVLLLATGITYALGESGLAGAAGLPPVLLMFALAFVKGLLVIDHFMELRHAPPLWRRLLIAWLALLASLIVVAYAVGLR